MKRKPLTLSVDIDGYQEDQIVGASLQESFKRMKTRRPHDPTEWPEDRDALMKALKLVYHYYTGKNLK
jgi:hypothetical protein